MQLEENEVILLKVSGQDKPGVTAGLSSILANYDAIILDIGQADIHDTLSLGILFEIKAGSTSGPVLKDLLFKAYELGIKVKFIPISIPDYEIWVKGQRKQRYIINVLGEKVYSLNLPQWSTIQKVWPPELAKGVYGVRVKSGVHSATKKIQWGEKQFLLR